MIGLMVLFLLIDLMRSLTTKSSTMMSMEMYDQVAPIMEKLKEGKKTILVNNKEATTLTMMIIHLRKKMMMMMMNMMALPSSGSWTIGKAMMTCFSTGKF